MPTIISEHRDLRLVRDDRGRFHVIAHDARKHEYQTAARNRTPGAVYCFSRATAAGLASVVNDSKPFRTKRAALDFITERNELADIAEEMTDE